MVASGQNRGQLGSIYIYISFCCEVQPKHHIFGDEGHVRDMSRMFYGARPFNMPIGSWNVSRVTDMKAMFYNAADFNQDIASWNTSAVRDMSFMFFGTSLGAFVWFGLVLIRFDHISTSIHTMSLPQTSADCGSSRGTDLEPQTSKVASRLLAFATSLLQPSLADDRLPHAVACHRSGERMGNGSPALRTCLAVRNGDIESSL